MKIEDIMIHLERLRQFCFKDGDNLLKVPMEGEWNMEQTERSLSEAMDILYDYEQVTKQNATFIKKYETPKYPSFILKGSVNIWKCPGCSRYINYGNEYCHWCGHAIKWRKAGDI